MLLWINPKAFDELLALVQDDIAKEDTLMWEWILPIIDFTSFFIDW